ncbi:MAG: AMP-binding protein, partial [Terriglobales bacterium]
AAARGHRQWGRVAGPMVNTLALRLNCDGNPTFAALVRQTRDVLLDALTHEEYPFALALREAPPEGAAAGLEAYFSLQPPGESPPAGWQLTHLDVDAAAAKFPVHLDLEATTGGLRGRCRYQRARVDAALGAALAEHWTVLLEGALPSPHRRLGGLPLLSAAHRRAVLALSRGPEPPLPAGSVAETFARQVAATPDAVALVVLGADGGAAQLPRRELSYAALLQDAERLAQGLHRAGVACGETVGVLLPPSADAVAVFLAVLLVGAAYLPLLPDDPPTCRERQLQASGARWLLGGEASGAWSLSLAALRQPGALPLPLLATRPDATACVMCTSGSTGEPRAVSIPHRGIVRLVCQPGYARFGPDESYLLLAPLGFDAATFEIWAPLLNGGRLVIPPPGLPAPADLEAIILREGVTTLWLTTTLFNTIIETAPQALAPLRQLLTGGEVMSPRHARQALQQLPGLALFNAYGPTENTTFTTIHRLSGIAGPIPLGRPIAHTAAYVVDDYGALAPQGVAGELWIGGAGLAAGVAGGAAEVQFACPDWAGGQRLFRSGDRMRWQDGELAFLGRRDQQIKLRGRRIELAAIEALLARHPGVRQAAVLASGAGADQVLTAYVAGVGISKQSLRAFLLAELPLAMIPTRWVMRPELPQSVHGKLDRQRLPALAETAAPASAAPAQSATEQRLVAIWRQALGRDGIGREDDFYALGGHSLQALRIVAQIEREFGRRLSLAAWPAHRTIAAQAAWIAGATAPQAADPRAVPLQIGDPARPCVYSLEAGDYFLRLAEQMGPQQPWWSLRLASLTALPHPSSMAAVAAYHAATLRRLQPTGPYYLAGWCQNGVVAFELARQLRAAGEHVACVVLVDAVSPAYLRRVAGLTWPVFRTRYAAHQWCQRQRNRRDPRLGPEPRPQVPPPAAVWRRWRYRWRHPSDPPRLGEPAAVVQYALRAYRPGPYPGRIVLFRSEHQILAAPTMGRFRDPAMGWQELAGAGLEIHEIDGDHMRIFSPPGVGQMARRLAAILARPQLRPVAGRAEAA